ncbi:MAG: molybdopterin-guanine dinucleotide biosynthesis protein B [Chloroflexi bacterium]|nr:molybdopterin-guanine dinucleotide biosynthesis protein B [Chloroflexota bacterium]
MAVVGRHNSGKTTFLTALLPLLVGRGLRVGYLKHAHASFEIDQPGKDSYRVRRTGVWQTIVTGGGQVAVIDDGDPEPSLDATIARYARRDLDLLIVEGFKGEPLPKIEIARGALSTELVCGSDPRLIAVVCDFVPGRSDVPRFALDDASGVADLIASRRR